MHCLAQTELFVCWLLRRGGRKKWNSTNFPSTFSCLRLLKDPLHRGLAPAPPPLCRQSPAETVRFSGRPR